MLDKRESAMWQNAYSIFRLGGKSVEESAEAAMAILDARRHSARNGPRDADPELA